MNDDYVPRILEKRIMTRARCEHRGSGGECYHSVRTGKLGECPRGEGFPDTCPLRRAE